MIYDITIVADIAVSLSFKNKLAASNVLMVFEAFVATDNVEYELRNLFRRCQRDRWI